MPACMEDKYHQAKFQMALKMISTTALEDMLTKERNPVSKPKGFHFYLTALITINIMDLYNIHHVIIFSISDKSGNETTSDSDGQ